MFEAAELGRKIDKADYKKQELALRGELLDVQQRLSSAARFPVIIVFAGVDGAGKGETVNLLSEWMDPRWLITRAFGQPSDEERDRPEYWRYWRNLPPRGRIGLFLSSWYRGRSWIASTSTAARPTLRAGSIAPCSSSARWPQTTPSSSSSGCTSERVSRNAGCASWKRIRSPGGGSASSSGSTGGCTTALSRPPSRQWADKHGGRAVAYRRRPGRGLPQRNGRHHDSRRGQQGARGEPRCASLHEAVRAAGSSEEQQDEERQSLGRQERAGRDDGERDDSERSRHDADRVEESVRHGAGEAARTAQPAAAARARSKGLHDPRVRGMGRGRQRRRDPPAHLGARRAALSGDSRGGADRRRTGAPLSLALLAPFVARRPAHVARRRRVRAERCWSWVPPWVEQGALDAGAQGGGERRVGVDGPVGTRRASNGSVIGDRPSTGSSARSSGGTRCGRGRAAPRWRRGAAQRAGHLARPAGRRGSAGSARPGAGRTAWPAPRGPAARRGARPTGRSGSASGSATARSPRCSRSAARQWSTSLCRAMPTSQPVLGRGGGSRRQAATAARNVSAVRSSASARRPQRASR